MEETNKISLSSIDNERMQSIDLTEIYAYGTKKVLVSEKEESKCNNITKRYKHDYLWWCYNRKHKRT